MDRKTHWEKIYTDKSPFDVSWYQKEPTLSLQLIHDTGIAKHACVIDVGGGASVLVDRLLEEGFRNVTVLDIAAGSLAYAKERLGEKAIGIEVAISMISWMKKASSKRLLRRLKSAGWHWTYKM